MDNIITDDTERHVEEIARDSIYELQPICRDCWNQNKDDPLGKKSGENTSCNKSMEAIITHLIKANDDLNEDDFSKIKSKLSELFYQNRNILIQGSDKLVNSELKCWYCFEQKKENENELAIHLENIEGKSKHLFERSNWR